MKKFYLPLALAAAFTMASCSSENDLPGSDANTPTIDLSNGGYVKLNVNKPSERGTRATTTEDGLLSEYGVKDATLILFKGKAAEDEGKAQFYGAYTLSKEDFTKTDNSQITITRRIVAPVGKDPEVGGSTGYKLYALVILNSHDIVSATNDNKLKWGDEVSHKDYTTLDNFINFSKAISSVDNTTGVSPFAANIDTKGIFMANAPLSTKQGGSVAPTDAEIKTLTDITSNVYSSESEAISKPAANVYVERAVAKVTLESAATGTVSAFDNKSNGKIGYKVLGWTLDNTNKASYLVRQYNNSWNSINSNKVADSSTDKYRFIYDTPVSTGVSLYRTMWAQDPEYDDGTYTADKYFISTTMSDKFGDENPQYCNENTFSVKGQNANQTTRVVLKVQLTVPGSETEFDNVGNLYTINGNNGVVYTNGTLANRLLNIFKTTNASVNNWLKNKTNVEATVTLSDPDTEGISKITNFTISSDEGNYTPSLVDEANKALSKITCYKDGIAYYAVRIKHFGDDATPWNQDGQGVTAGNNANIYNTTNPESTNWFLGRYGVVRNNWYNISVNGVSALGNAVIKRADETPDDMLNNYIAVSINVLSWAKHSQGTILQ